MIITNATTITWDIENPLIENSDIVIIEDKIADVGIPKDIRDKYST